MSAPKSTATPATGAQEEELPADAAGPQALIESAKLQGDVEGLLKLAKQLRSGGAHGKPDMRACFDAYRAAAELGSAVAQHAVGLFHLNGGGGLERSERDAALSFRAAADQGHLASKVLVGNLYELGVHYRADAAKADVWYRNVARSANVEAEPDSPEYVRALADLGCVRYCLALIEAPDTTEADRARYGRLAKTYGYKPDDGARTSITAEQSTLDAVEAEAEAESKRSGALAAEKAASGAKPSPAAAAKSESAKEEPKKKVTPGAAPKVNVGLASAGFFLTLLFMAIGVVLGHVLRHLALEKIASGGAVPVFGTNAEAILPAFVLVLGVAPNLLFYRAAAFGKAVLFGAAAAIGAEVLWGMDRHFLESRVMQITDFGVAGLLVGLLVFGLFGGVKPGSK